jgi:16S rRNA (guanine966-N2)-methyltransferase
MSALQFDLPDAGVVDLFAGSGALGLEALSRGAAHATFVEVARAPLRALESNLRRLGVRDEADIVRADALAWAARLPAGAYDLALADPPYDGDAATRLAEIFLATPFATWLWIEHRAGLVLPAPPGARTRRYGDTALTAIPAPLRP